MMTYDKANVYGDFTYKNDTTELLKSLMKTQI